MVQEQRFAISDFATHAHEHVLRLKATGEPELLTLDGEGDIIVQDATAYQRILDRLDSLEAVAAVRESVAQYGRGEGKSARSGHNLLREQHDIPLSN